ncbi:MAG: hypothetical protein KGI36_03325 [Burkholderiales bacterium]|nr:hypothetical protein [Burkholderiales bacterium]
MITTKRARYVIVVALAAAVVGLLPWIGAGMADRTAPVESVRLADPTAPSVAAAAVAIDARARTRTPLRQRQALVAAAGAALAASAGAGVWDLCGIGRMPLPPELAASAVSAAGLFAELPVNLGEQALAAAQERLLAAMDAGGARSRAAALLMRQMAYPAPANAPTPQFFAQQLAGLAAGSGDPVLLAWAAQRCNSSTPCSTDPAGEWARIEPGNAVPWLLIATQQPQRRPQALAALAHANSYSSHYGAVSETALKAMPADIPAYLQPRLLMQISLVDAGMGDAGIAKAINLCRPAPEAGSQRQALCRSLGALMVRQGDAAISYLIGLRVQELSGLPDVHYQQRRAEMQKLISQTNMSLFDWQHPYTCATVDRWQRWTRDRAKLGELGAARTWAAAAASAASAASAAGR